MFLTTTTNPTPPCPLHQVAKEKREVQGKEKRKGRDHRIHRGRQPIPTEELELTSLLLKSKDLVWDNKGTRELFLAFAEHPSEDAIPVVREVYEREFLKAREGKGAAGEEEKMHILAINHLLPPTLRLCSPPPRSRKSAGLDFAVELYRQALRISGGRERVAVSTHRSMIRALQYQVEELPMVLEAFEYACQVGGKGPTGGRGGLLMKPHAVVIALLGRSGREMEAREVYRRWAEYREGLEEGIRRGGVDQADRAWATILGKGEGWEEGLCLIQDRMGSGSDELSLLLIIRMLCRHGRVDEAVEEVRIRQLPHTGKGHILRILLLEGMDWMSMKGRGNKSAHEVKQWIRQILALCKEHGSPVQWSWWMDRACHGAIAEVIPFSGLMALYEDVHPSGEGKGF